LYLDIWKGKVHTTQFGFQAMRVLTVTPSRKRVETMVEAAHDLTNGNRALPFRRSRDTRRE
jgi:hypothetical protein